jgi:hypothetical protein
MNTPDNTNKQLELPNLIKNKSSVKIGFKLFNKIKKNLNEDFDLVNLNLADSNLTHSKSANMNNSKKKIYKSAKIFPEINVNCTTPELKPRSSDYHKNIPSPPKKKINIPRLNLLQNDLDVLRTRLFEDNELNFPLTPQIANKTIYTPNAPIKNAKNTQELFLDDVENLIYSDNCSIDSGLDILENVKRQLVF